MLVEIDPRTFVGTLRAGEFPRRAVEGDRRQLAAFIRVETAPARGFAAADSDRVSIDRIAKDRPEIRPLVRRGRESEEDQILNFGSPPRREDAKKRSPRKTRMDTKGIL